MIGTSGNVSVWEHRRSLLLRFPSLLLLSALLVAVVACWWLAVADCRGAACFCAAAVYILLRTWREGHLCRHAHHQQCQGSACRPETVPRSIW